MSSRIAASRAAASQKCWCGTIDESRPAFLLAASALVASALAQTPQPPLADKTLVVWVAPANLTQRGGSALTIDDGRDNFDAIVFGELDFVLAEEKVSAMERLDLVPDTFSCP